MYIIGIRTLCDSVTRGYGDHSPLTRPKEEVTTPPSRPQMQRYITIMYYKDTGIRVTRHLVSNGLGFRV